MGETEKICSIKDCNNKLYSRGYCRKHYDKWRNYGDPLHVTRKDPNPIIIHENFAEIILTNTKNKALVDLDDIDKIRNYKWYERTDHYVAAVTKDKKSIKLHQFVMPEKKEKIDIDHINHDRLDNRKSNLRFATRTQNSQNRSLQSNNNSGVPGIYWHKQHKKWQALIVVNGERIDLGRYENLEDAKNIRKEAEIKYFGEWRADYGNSIAN